MNSGKDSRPGKIKTEDLRVGMFVVDVGRSWLRHPWATKSKHITSQKDIDDLIKCGISEVTIDPKKGLPTPKPNVTNKEADSTTYREFGIRRPTLEQARQVTPNQVVASIGLEEPPKPAAETIQQIERRTRPRPAAPKREIPMTEELPRAKKVYQQALETTREFIAEAKAGRNIDVDKVQESVNEMIDSIFRNRDSIVALLKLKTYDEYTFNPQPQCGGTFPGR